MKMNVGARTKFGVSVGCLLLAGIAPGIAAADIIPVPAAPVVATPTVTEATASVAPVTDMVDATTDATAAAVGEVASEPPLAAVAPMAESVATVVGSVDTTPVVEGAAAAADEIVAAIPPVERVPPSPAPTHESWPSTAPAPTAADAAPAVEAAPAARADWTAPPAAPTSATTSPSPQASSAPQSGVRRAAAARPESPAAQPPEAVCHACAPVAAPRALLVGRATTVVGDDVASPPLPSVPRRLLEVASAAAAGSSGTGFLIVTLALFLLIRLPRRLRVSLEPCVLRQALFSTPLERPG
jgi:hypothetical protein